jgi:hypothetical protein
MNNVSYLNQPQPKKKSKKKSGSSMTYNILTGVVLLITLVLIYVFASLSSNPFSGLNPFPPPTWTPTPPPPTVTPIQLKPTWTPTPTTPPTITSTPRPTYTLEPSFTPFSFATRTPKVSPTRTPTASKTPKLAGLPYSATVTVNDSTTFIPDSTCATMYIAGQALDANSAPVTALQVRLSGNLPGKSFAPGLVTLTGIAPAFGPSGFEFNLGIKPATSSKTLWVQLLDQAGAPLSDQIFLTTSSDCKKNLVLVRFQMK